MSSVPTLRELRRHAHLFFSTNVRRVCGDVSYEMYKGFLLVDSVDPGDGVRWWNAYRVERYAPWRTRHYRMAQVFSGYTRKDCRKACDDLAKEMSAT